jgi:hypothetical protein
MNTPSFFARVAGRINLQRLDEIEARLNALPPSAYSCTLYPEDLSALGIPATHKRRRYIAWVQRKIEAKRMQHAAEVARVLTR